MTRPAAPRWGHALVRAMLLAGSMAAAAQPPAAPSTSTISATQAASASPELASASGQPVSAERRAQAQAFWSTFRAAVARRDLPALAALCTHPLLLRGPTDAQPQRKVAASALAPTLTRLLEQRVYPIDGSPPARLAEVVARQLELPPRAWLTPESFRVEQLEFRWKKDRWLLARAYLDDE